MPITEDFVKHLMEQNAALLAQNAAMTEQISQLTKTVESLNQTIQKLQEQLNKNSKNSSKSPSSDGFKKPPVNKERSLRQPSGKKQAVRKDTIAPQLHEFAAFTFEDICREYIREMQKARALPFRYAKMGRWSGKTPVRGKEGAQIAETEIDIVAVSSQNQEYLIGECKFKGRPFSYAEYLDTMAKLAPQKEKAQFYYALFSESGFDEKIEAEAENNEYLRLCNLEKIVNLEI